jgi:hypothetical protein
MTFVKEKRNLILPVEAIDQVSLSEAKRKLKDNPEQTVSTSGVCQFCSKADGCLLSRAGLSHCKNFSSTVGSSVRLDIWL